jgi:hypothetical protein
MSKTSEIRGGELSQEDNGNFIGDGNTLGGRKHLVIDIRPISPCKIAIEPRNG